MTFGNAQKWTISPPADSQASPDLTQTVTGGFTARPAHLNLTRTALASLLLVEYHIAPSRGS